MKKVNRIPTKHDETLSSLYVDDKFPYIWDRILLHHNGEIHVIHAHVIPSEIGDKSFTINTTKDKV